MIVTPKSAPAPVEGAISAHQQAAAKRQAAIAAFNGGVNQAQPAPVSNPSKVSAEEMTAVTAKKPEEESLEGQTPTTDAPPAEAPKEATAPKEVPLSSQYAQLARKEKAIRAQQLEMKQQEAAFKAREDAIKAKEAEMQSAYIPKDRFAKEPWKVLSESGITYDQLTEQVLNAPSPEAQAHEAVIARLEAKIQALEDGQNTTKKTFEDSQKQAYTQAVSQIRTDAKQLVYTNPDYETIKATNSAEDVVELITKTFHADGVLLTVEEAAAAVEEYLVEEGLKIAKLDKIQKRLKPATAAPAAPASKDAKQPQMKTLTNTVGSTRQLSAKERAMLAFKGEKY